MADGATSNLKLIHSCDALIREGRLSEVKGILKKLNSADVATKEKCAVAKLCRRVGLNRHAVRIIAQGVPRPLAGSLDSKTLAEYALNLQRLGSTLEAISLLESIRVGDVPEAALFLAYCHMSRWDYEAALSQLHIYSGHVQDPYERAVVEVNSAACLIFLGRSGPAKSLLPELAARLSAGNWNRLLGNVHELWAQALVAQEEWAAAGTQIQKATAILGAQGTNDSLFLQKWASVIEAGKSGRTEPLLKMRNKVLLKGHWESVRDIDFHLLKMKKDQALLDRLFFGTPHEIYRQRIVKMLGAPSKTCLVPYSGEIALQLATGTVSGRVVFMPGKVAQRMLTALTRDLYRPAPLAELFAALYPEEYFDIFSSPDRVHQAIRRTRKAISESGLPLKIKCQNESYRLEFGAPLCIELSLIHKTVSQHDHRILKLRQVFAGRPFTASEACSHLSLSHSNTNRILKRAVEDGDLQMIPLGPATYYKAA